MLKMYIYFFSIKKLTKNNIHDLILIRNIYKLGAYSLKEEVGEIPTQPPLL